MELSRQKLNLYWPLIPAGGLLLFCGWLLIGSSGQLPFTVKLLERECRRLETLRKNILDLREQNRQLRLETRPMTAIREGALAVDGDTAAVRLREQVERIAAASGITISSLREIQQVPAAEGWIACTLSFSAECAVADLQEFLAGVDNNIPRLYWRTLTLRPDNTNTPSKVILDGQLALLNHAEEEE